MPEEKNDNQDYKGPKRVFSGIQPSGDMHLGNYLGAIKKFVDLQQDNECLYCIVDLHAITVWQDPKLLPEQTRHIAAAYLASGVDPEKAIVYNQSAVRAHTELAWYFNCVARVGWLDRMTQFKDKAGKNSEKMSVGLYDYPVLQAADILAFKATHVPVGEDQKQHLELSRDIAAKFNHDFNVPNFFPRPEPMIKGPGARIMSLRDATKKMSKSDASEASRINLTDTAEQISKKIRKAKSDAALISPIDPEGEDRPELKNLVGIYSALSGKTFDAVIAEYEGSQWGPFKSDLADLTVEKMSPITDLMNRYLADPEELNRILATAADKAAEIADPIVADVRKIIGFCGA